MWLWSDALSNRMVILVLLSTSLFLSIFILNEFTPALPFIGVMLHHSLAFSSLKETLAFQSIFVAKDIPSSFPSAPMLTSLLTRFSLSADKANSRSLSAGFSTSSGASVIDCKLSSPHEIIPMLIKAVIAAIPINLNVRIILF